MELHSIDSINQLRSQIHRSTSRIVAANMRRLNLLHNITMRNANAMQNPDSLVFMNASRLMCAAIKHWIFCLQFTYLHVV